MKTKHTKGEWIASEGQIYPQETGKTLCLIPYFDKENEEMQSNQKLIAAAPELLEALKEFTMMFAGDFFMREKMGINDVYTKANEVISKATQ